MIRILFAGESRCQTTMPGSPTGTPRLVRGPRRGCREPEAKAKVRIALAMKAEVGNTSDCSRRAESQRCSPVLYLFEATFGLFSSRNAVRDDVDVLARFQFKCVVFAQCKPTPNREVDLIHEAAERG